MQRLVFLLIWLSDAAGIWGLVGSRPASFVHLARSVALGQSNQQAYARKRREPFEALATILFSRRPLPQGSTRRNINTRMSTTLNEIKIQGSRRESSGKRFPIAETTKYESEKLLNPISSISQLLVNDEPRNGQNDTASEALQLQSAQLDPLPIESSVDAREKMLVGQVLSPAEAIKGLYKAFNSRNASTAATFLSDDCIYEDLLLGPATVCKGKDAFMNALRFHPAFVGSYVFGGLPFAERIPELTIEIDSVAEGIDSVGVEWHVEVGGVRFPLGRGLSHAQVDTLTGKITRVVDIAEAPWRVVGLVLQPFFQFLMSRPSNNESFIVEETFVR